MIRTVIFDIDNTLYDCIGLDRAVTREVLVPYLENAFGWSEREYLTRLGKATQEMIDNAGCNGSCRNRLIRYQLMLERAGLPIYPHALTLYDLYWKEMLRRMTPYDGAAEVMAALRKRGIRIGIGTDLTSEIQYRKLYRLGLIQYVDFIVTSEEASVEKPAELFFRHCLEKARCAPEECLFVGDVIAKDYQGAVSAGMQAVWFNSRSEPEKPGIKKITDLSELLDM